MGDPAAERQGRRTATYATGCGFPHCVDGIGGLGECQIPGAGESSKPDRTTSLTCDGNNAQSAFFGEFCCYVSPSELAISGDRLPVFGVPLGLMGIAVAVGAASPALEAPGDRSVGATCDLAFSARKGRRAPVRHLQPVVLKHPLFFHGFFRCNVVLRRVGLVVLPRPGLSCLFSTTGGGREGLNQREAGGPQDLPSSGIDAGKGAGSPLLSRLPSGRGLRSPGSAAAQVWPTSRHLIIEPGGFASGYGLPLLVSGGKRSHPPGSLCEREGPRLARSQRAKFAGSSPLAAGDPLRHPHSEFH